MDLNEVLVQDIDGDLQEEEVNFDLNIQIKGLQDDDTEGPISMVVASYDQSTDNSEGVVNQVPIDLMEENIVLALPAPPVVVEQVNFLHLEIQLHELNASIEDIHVPIADAHNAQLNDDQQLSHLN